MYIGLFSTNTDYGIRPDELAKACEVRDFESLWLPEHTHIPALLKTLLPDFPVYKRAIYHHADPFVSLMAAAAVTTSPDTNSTPHRAP